MRPERADYKYVFEREPPTLSMSPDRVQSRRQTAIEPALERVLGPHVDLLTVPAAAYVINWRYAARSGSPSM